MSPALRARSESSVLSVPPTQFLCLGSTHSLRKGHCRKGKGADVLASTLDCGRLHCLDMARAIIYIRGQQMTDSPWVRSGPLADLAGDGTRPCPFTYLSPMTAFPAFSPQQS